MIRFLGIDPSYTNTALAIVGDDGPDWVRAFPVRQTRKDDAEQMEARMLFFFEQLDVTLKQFTDVVHVAMERIDWHQNSHSKGFNYQRERNTQASMAAFNTYLVSYKQMSQQRIGRVIEVHFIGVNKWKSQFGAMTKAGVADVCHAMFPDRVLYDRERGEYRWHADNHVLSDDETDSIAIAVTARDSFLHPELERFVPRVRGRR